MDGLKAVPLQKRLIFRENLEMPPRRAVRGGKAAAYSAAFFTFCQDGGLEALPQSCGQLIDFVVAINLDGLLGGAHRDHAVVASLEVGLQVGNEARGDLMVEKVAELRQKL
jgi:hypothetical protein